KSRRLRTIDQLNLKRTVGADERAERNMTVVVAKWAGSDTCLAWESSRHRCRYNRRVVIRAVAHNIRCRCQITSSMRNVVLVLFCANASGFAQTSQPMPTPSVVYTMHDSNAIKDYKTNPSIVRA